VDCTEMDRFMSKVEVMDWGCWFWTGARNNKGYAAAWIGGKSETAHVVAYQQFVGPVPDGYEVDHLCRFRCCVNPDHLEAVTPRENTLRRAKRRINLTCRRGHPLSGRGYCVECKKQADARRWRRYTEAG
jgi:HNH endonuclease